MHVPPSPSDFLDRASPACGDRAASVEGPGSPGSLGRANHHELVDPEEAERIALDRRGVAWAESVMASDQASPVEP